MGFSTHTEREGTLLVPRDSTDPRAAGTGPMFTQVDGKLYRLVPVEIPAGDNTRTNVAAWASRNGWPDCTRQERVHAWMENIWFLARRGG